MSLCSYDLWKYHTFLIDGQNLKEKNSCREGGSNLTCNCSNNLFINVQIPDYQDRISQIFNFMLSDKKQNCSDMEK